MTSGPEPVGPPPLGLGSSWGRAGCRQRERSTQAGRGAARRCASGKAHLPTLTRSSLGCVQELSTAPTERLRAHARYILAHSLARSGKRALPIAQLAAAPISPLGCYALRGGNQPLGRLYPALAEGGPQALVFTFINVNFTTVNSLRLQQ